MQAFTIASGSAGNCTLVRDGQTSILIDAGISARRITDALASLEVAVEQLSGILITHEHSDHIRGLATLIKRHNVPIYAPGTVANHLDWAIAGISDHLRVLPVGEKSSLDGLDVTAFRTPHDTPESVGYRISGSGVFGFCTDCGHITDEVLQALSGVDAAVIEANHDPDMLRCGPYPAQLKLRILSDHGHLSNECCGALAVKLAQEGARQLVLGHLSLENNTPSLALKTVSDALLGQGVRVGQDVRVLTAPPSQILGIRFGETDKC